MSLDHTAEELIFSVDLQPENWLAVGLAGDFMDKVDVIHWMAGATGYDTENLPSDFSEEINLRT